ncbi:outer membrane porin protein [Caballeronia terrestris]|jgi:predicted porin|uniref:Outer membrane porin protein n=1 Tax=Caballeronia terrestris TaxID=1226301 RepID=A0A158J4M1_9BURK|nr:porin [Caballeronia terrestris]SAL63413.1 outer membrane porin protein [Caballeronia terrestris]
MKRNSISMASIAAIATGGFSGAAQAQSSVTLYGIVDAGVEYVNHASADGGAARLVSGGKNTSRFGMRGVEELGGGLKAIFQLESGINVANGQLDDGPNALFDRRATVGLKHKTYGQVILGRTFTTTYDYMLPFDPMAYAPNYSWATGSTATGGRKDGLFSRSANAVRYDGEFSGFKIGAMYGFGNVPDSMKTSSKYDFGLGYASGPFAVVATFDRQNGANDSVTPADTTNYIQGIHAGASYDFGAAKVMAGYRNYRRTFNTLAETLRSDMYWFGGSYDFAPDFTLYAAVYHQDIKGANDGDPTLLSLRANYSLSKRTTLYLSGGYAFARNDQNVSLSRDLTGAADTQAGVTAGLQHRF